MSKATRNGRYVQLQQQMRVRGTATAEKIFYTWMEPEKARPNYKWNTK